VPEAARSTALLALQRHLSKLLYEISITWPLFEARRRSVRDALPGGLGYRFE